MKQYKGIANNKNKGKEKAVGKAAMKHAKTLKVPKKIKK